MNLEQRAKFSTQNVEGEIQQTATNQINNHNIMSKTAKNQINNHNAQSHDMPMNKSAASPTDAETVKLHEERLIVDKNRQKIGEVGIGKHTETETMQVSTPVEQEHVVITSVPGSGEKVDNSNRDPFNYQKETARVEVFEETPSVRKEAFVREEVGMTKKTTQETVNTEEKLRREKLDVDSQGRPIVDDNTKRGNQHRR